MGPYGICPRKAMKSLTCHTNESDEKPANGGTVTSPTKFRKTGSLLRPLFRLIGLISALSELLSNPPIKMFVSDIIRVGSWISI